jgi:hypothetical protein
MAVEDWLAAFEVTDAAGLGNTQARDVLAFLQRHASRFATVVEVRKDANRDLIVVDILTGAPQAPVYPILRGERIGILFYREDRLPSVVMLRDTFPDTEHQQIVPEGHPFVICIDDRPWSEARLTWTPAELVDRIVWWFRRAARGELQDARQPLDPILMGSGLSFIMPRSILDAAGAHDLVGEYEPTFKNMLRVRRRAEVGRLTAGMEPVTVMAYRIVPQRMERMRRAPTEIAGLATWLNNRGVDLLADLRTRLADAFDKGTAAAWQLQGRAAVIVEIPIQSPRDDRDTGVDVRAFITSRSAGDIAVSLGIALKQEDRSEGSRVGYVKAIPATSPDMTGLAAIVVQSAEVNLEFERDLATRLAGRQTVDARRAVLVGAGAIGSQVADDLTREGRFEWTIIDDDQVLPHNLARHIAVSAEVTKPKAEIVAAHLNSILSGAPIAVPISANLFSTGGAEEAVRRALDNAEIIIDTTASVVAARALSDGPFAARRISAFFNPTGEAAVVLAEPCDRSATLRDLEAQYYGLLLRTPHLADHLGKLAQTVAYTGACRAITNRIPASRAAILSGLAANGIASIVDRDDGAIQVWSLSASGEVAVDAPALEPVIRYRAKGWTIGIDVGVIRRICTMRQAKLPRETGGILFGLVDIPAKQIQLVEATPAPPDSVEEPGQFVRGMEGVDEMMEDVQRRTAGQIRYVGEWHSHPPRYSARPSAVDGMQLDWLAALMGMDSMPGLMVIAADTHLAVILARERAECVDTGSLSGHPG